MSAPAGFWPDCGFAALARDVRGWLAPTDDYLRWLLARPELALVLESCPAEVALHESLRAAPSRSVDAADIAALQDSDARENYAVFLRFRDALLNAGSIEACYLRLVRSGMASMPPVFMDAMVQAVLCNLLAHCDDALQVRAAEMLFRPQRVALQDGQVLAGDQATLDLLNETAGLGEVGRLLRQGGVAQPAVAVQVLSADNAETYWAQGGRYHFLLDLTHEVTHDLSHGLTLRMARARSGLKALSRVLERWVQHFLGVQVHIEPVHQVADSAWRWHVGLDVESTAILNDLYQGQPVEAHRLQRLVSLFTLTFANPAEMRADLAGKPVYLGLATTAEGTVRLKPQNLLSNLPLASAS